MSTTTRKKRTLTTGKKVLFAVVATLFSLLVLAMAAKAYAALLGIQDHEFRYENQVSLLASDPLIGFRNAENYDDYCFLTVHVETNGQGFRGKAPTAREKPADTLRIIGLGDSVMWGTGVNQADSFLGLLQTKLDGESRDYEVINSGVIGYSALQEAWLLEQHLLDYSPDIVMVNLCQNDMLPSDNPFANVRDIYIQYTIKSLADPRLSNEERQIAVQILKLFQSDQENVFAVIASAPVEVRRVLIKMYVEFPIQRMIELSRQNNFRLVYLLIPSRADDSLYGPLVAAVEPLLAANQIEMIDFQDLYTGNPMPQPGFLSKHVWPKLRQTPFRDLHNVLMLKNLEARQQQDNFIDYVHPTKKGNKIIAERIFQHLKDHPSP